MQMFVNIINLDGGMTALPVDNVDPRQIDAKLIVPIVFTLQAIK